MLIKAKGHKKVASAAATPSRALGDLSRDGVEAHLVHKQIGRVAKRRVSKLHRAAERLKTAAQEARQYAEDIVDSVRDPLVVLDSIFKVISANRSFYAAVGVTREETEGESIFAMGSGEWNIPELRDLLQRILPEHTVINGFRVEHDFSRIGRKVMLINARQVRRRGVGQQLILLAMEDVTRREEEINIHRESESRYRSLFDASPDGILMTSPDGRIISANPAAEAMFAMTEEEICRAGRQGIIDPEDIRLALAIEERAREGRTRGVVTYVRKDGSKFEGDFVSVVIDANALAFVIIRDITERVRAEDALRESEARLRGIFENAAVGISLFDPAGRLMHANSKLCEILGYSEDELRGQSFDSFTYFEDQEADRSHYEKLMGGGLGSYTVEKRYVRKDGSLVWVRVTRSAQLDERNRPEYCVTVVENIAERKQAEDELQRTTTLLRAITENTPDFVFVKDRQGRMLLANQATLKDLGKAPEEVIGKTDAEFLGGEAGEKIMENDRMVMESGETLVVEEIPHPDGDRRVYLSSKSPYFDSQGKVIGLIGISRDITERKRAQQETETQRQLLEAVINKLRSGVLIVRGADLRIVMLNPAYALMAPGKEMLNRKLDEVWPEVPALSQLYRKVLETGEPYHAVDDAFNISLVPGGPTETRYFTWSLQRVRLPGESDWGLLSTVWETTQWKRSEMELRASKELLSKVLESLPVGVWLMDRQGTVVHANNAAKEIWGGMRHVGIERYSEYKGWWVDSGKRIADEEWGGARAILKGETSLNEEVEIECFDGSRKIILNSAIPIRDEKGGIAGAITVNQDITRRKGAEKDRELLLAEVQRSNEELQQFAYVASHDLQEPLRMVSSYIQLLDRKYGEQLDEKARKYMRHAVDGVVRMQKLIDGLLMYSRISRGDRLLQVDMNDVFSAATANLEQAVRIAKGKVTSDPLPVVKGAETQLIQLLQNLIGNGLKYRKADVAPEVHVSAHNQGMEFVFAVADNGIGIDPHHYERIFQIFQRLHTQDEYPGTGIGLASCKKIVERHGGRIWVDSEPGRGSTFYFTLPASQ